MTYADKMSATYLALVTYRDSIHNGDADYPSAVAHVQYRDDLKAYGTTCVSLAKGGPGSNPPGPPPPPPGI